MTTNDPLIRPEVLVAEDDRTISDVIRFNLERAGYRVTLARDGLEAWGLLQSMKFDMFVTDYQMPRMTGEEVCRALRINLPDLHLPIVFLSARGMELNVERMKQELGIETLLFKPFSPRELVQEIAKCLEKSIALVRSTGG
jgi:CheY-like chemotaxis protein